MELPYQERLPVPLLAACFNNTSASYKFYWFLGILNRLEQGETTILKRHLFAEMTAQAWYTVNYFKVSFGKQDKLHEAIERIKGIEILPIDMDRDTIFKRLTQTTNKSTLSELSYFNGEVPHRFLSPWFRTGDKQVVYQSSQCFENDCMYALYLEYIELNPAWIGYLTYHSRILKNFCYWNLAVYLQNRNPNVPDLPNKLIKLPVRKALTTQRKFWDLVIIELGSVDCIYTNKPLFIGNYSVEHFLPYAFVSHDLMWNLIPANKSFNSSKSDKLPPLDRYFEPFFKLQK
ncbi:HNH endonuclease domain-containing protein [Pararcticibacter amylolyticus]|uniref:HNH endonuclease domain-containing protein n=1 Tax=Pararcticibacter amylolyticus TaxID=2173175 RepID=UPI001EE48BE8|nr:HNH endonuclease domain-containing protein [Pararcticibacter amylolyticus]